MKTLLLGATGRTGKHVLDSLLEKRHECHVLARNSERIAARDGLTVFEGNPADPGDLGTAMEGCEAVIGVLNISRKSDFPWSGLRTPERYLSEVMRHLIPLAEKTGARRVVICSAWGVAETKNDIPGWFRWFINNSKIGIAYRDHERQEALLSASDLDWTIVRPVGLTNSQKKETVRETLNHQPRPSLTISRKSLAAYMVDCLADAGKIGQKITVSKGT